MTDSKLDDIEAWIEEEAKRVDHLHPKDAKNNCDQIERELQRIDEEVIKQMFNDVKILRDNRYSQANELHRRYKTFGLFSEREFLRFCINATSPYLLIHLRLTNEISFHS